MNRPIFFRRALKLVNGGNVSGDQQLPIAGLDGRVREPCLRAGQLQRDGGIATSVMPTETHMAAHPRRLRDAAVEQLERQPSRSSPPTTSTAAPGLSTRPAIALPSSPARACRFPGRRRAATRSSSSAPTAASATSCACSRTGTSGVSPSTTGLDRQPVHQPAGDRDLQVQHRRL